MTAQPFGDGFLSGRRGSRSSLHYDPYQNLLCVVLGTKRVRLYSPAATPYLYPMPVYGESPNHSEVDVTCPDLDRHPLYPRAAEFELVAVLEVYTAASSCSTCPKPSDHVLMPLSRPLIPY